MSIKILGGLAKGTKLYLPDINITRPTLVLLKRRIFDSLQKFEGKIFIDACAGSGSIGLEAWSRGANKVVFSEPDNNIFSILKKNITLIKNRVSDDSRKIEAFNISFEDFLRKFENDYGNWETKEQENCIIYLDPPYSFHEFYKNLILGEILKKKWFKGTLWVESDEKKGIPLLFWKDNGVQILKYYAHGHSYIFVARL